MNGTSPRANAHNCSGPITRRTALKFGALGLGGLTLGDVFRLQAQAGTAAAHDDRAVIFIWLPGGPPHMEMYDLKPDAPSEYRGEFRPIRTNVSGVEVGELLPLHAKCADKFNIIRSLSHKFADHGGGHKRFMMAREPKEPTGTVNDHPAVASMIAKVVEGRQRGLPNYVAGMDAGRQGIDTFAFGSAYLGSSTEPFSVPGDPSSPKFTVENLAPLAGLDSRVKLLRQLDKWGGAAEKSGAFDSLDQFNRRAVELVTSGKAQAAFDLSKEPEALKDRYGRHAYGARCLLARRLVEAGCTFVTMVLENPMPGKDLPNYVSYNWDSHAVNCHIFNDAKVRLPLYDQAVTALIEDLYQRGLDRRVLLFVTGEFGRTPRLSYSVGTASHVMQPGRDHWPNAMSMIVSGGGMRTGQVIGATNSKGEFPTERPLTPNDLWATVLQHLGIDPQRAFNDFAGRPVPILPFGDPIRELLPTG
ncbi:MAG TPA: DUF1501 domain-containing protein [Pirellulales bacterium]|nr:DUF1501 domain-containing protein [Pirellulales bacterium]